MLIFLLLHFTLFKSLDQVAFESGSVPQYDLYLCHVVEEKQISAKSKLKSDIL